MKEKDIPDGFIERDIRDTQYIAKKAKAMCEELVKTVISTTGSITDRLREDWQLIDVMKELNWDKYQKLGLTEIVEKCDYYGNPVKVRRIKDWTKRSDHRHHAMDALTVAFTKYAHIQFFNHINSHYDSKSEIYGIKQKYFTEDNKALPPIPLKDFRTEAKKQLENILVSIKARNKVVTKSKNKANGQKTLAPRGQLHNETIYGSIKQPLVKIDKKTGKKNVEFETLYTIRKEVGPDLNVEKVIDLRVKNILKERLAKFGNDPKKAFVNLEEDPIWFNKEKGIEVKRVAISGVANAVAIHGDKDFVSPSNNHHVAIYKDKNGKLQEVIVSFFEAVQRANKNLPIINKEYNKDEGWEFLFTMKQNEYFVFSNENTGFNPQEIDLMNPENYSLISLNLFRVQKIATKDYWFRHHLETKIEKNNLLKGTTWIRCGLNAIDKIVKVRVDHIGHIVSVGEY